MDILPSAPPSRSGPSRNASSDAGEPFAAMVDDSAQADMPQATAPASAADTSTAAPAISAPVPVIVPPALAEELALDLMALIPTEGEVATELTDETAADPLAAFLEAVAVATTPEEVPEELTDGQAGDTPDIKPTDSPAPVAGIAVATVPTLTVDAATDALPVDALLAETAPAQVPMPNGDTDAAPTGPAADQTLPSGDDLTDGAAPQTAKPSTDAPPANGLREQTDGLEPSEPKTNSSGQPANPVAALAGTLGPARSAEAQANKTDATADDAAPVAEADADRTAKSTDTRDVTSPLKSDATAPESPAKADASTTPAAERPAVSTVDPSAARTPAFHILMQQQDVRHVPGASPTETDAAMRAIPVSGIALEIATQFRENNVRFDIRLDPPDLGRIDVRLDMDRQGQVTSRLVVEKSETLDLLRRDAPQLERALQDAGLKTGDNGLQFSLRDQSLNGRDDDQAQGNSAKLVVTDDEITPLQSQAAAYGRALARGGLDISV